MLYSVASTHPGVLIYNTVQEIYYSELCHVALGNSVTLSLPETLEAMFLILVPDFVLDFRLLYGAQGFYDAIQWVFIVIWSQDYESAN